MVWVIRYIVGVLIKHDAWDVIVIIPLTHATNGNSTQVMPKFHACWQTQRPRLGQPCNEQVPPSFFFDFSQDN